MSFLDRVDPYIRLFSPQKDQFDALWAGDDRSFEKKHGVFSPPGTDGSTIQDLGSNSSVYPLTIYFTGADHDLEAERFFQACRQRGQWTIFHPVKGSLLLNLSSVSEMIDPVQSANVTSFRTQWIEQIDTFLIRTPPALQAAVIAAVKDVAASPVPAGVKQDTFSKISAIKDAANKAIAAVREKLAPLYKIASDIKGTVQDITSTAQSIYADVQNVVSQATIEVQSLTGQISALINLPSQIATDLKVRVKAFQGALVGVLDLLPGVSHGDDESRNRLIIYEHSLHSVNASICQSVVTGDLQSRPQAVEMMKAVTDSFSSLTDALDDAQSLFDGAYVEGQYVAGSELHQRSLHLTALTLEYLLRASFDLLIERRVILRTDRAPIEIVLSEYGDPEKFDFFIESNELSGDDILILPAGREIKLYA